MTQNEIDVPRTLQVRLSTSSWTAISVYGAFDDEMRYLSGNPQIRHIEAEPGRQGAPRPASPAGFAPAVMCLIFLVTSGKQMAVPSAFRGSIAVISFQSPMTRIKTVYRPG